VRPVDHRRDAGIEGLECAEQRGGVHIGRSHVPAEAAPDAAAVLLRGEVRAEAAQRRLPRVPVGVDQPRHDDAAGGVHPLGVTGVEVVADRDDGVALDENVAAGELADRRIHRDDVAAADEHPRIRHGCRFSRRWSARPRRIECIQCTAPKALSRHRQGT
jgi:hypothetical protein